MKKLTTLTATVSAVVILALFLIPALASAQVEDGRGNPNKGGGSCNGNSYFDTSTVDTFTGTLLSDEGDWEPWGNGNHTGDGQHFRLQASNGTTYELMLGNYYYMQEIGLVLNAGDTVTVKGSLVEPYRSGYETYDYIIAQEVNGFALRDENGYPLWRGDYGNRNGGKGNGYGENYWDPATVDTFNGTFTTELGFWMAHGNGNHTGTSMHYIFEANNGTEFYAMVGPFWFLEQNGIYLEEGVKAKLTGSVVEPHFDDYTDHDYLIVSEITVGDVTLQLRDEDGYPLWKGVGGYYSSPSYDGSSTKTVTGTVTNVKTRTYGASQDEGYELKIRANGKKYKVFVAPEYYANMLGLSVGKGQEVKIKGSVNGKEIVARTLSCDGSSYQLRDRKGNPKWEVGTN